MDKQLKIMLVKSLIGVKPIQRRVVQSLGLKRIRQEVVHNDSAVIRGMVNKVSHMVKVLEI